MAERELELHNLRESHRLHKELEKGLREASHSHLQQMRKASRELKDDYGLKGSQLNTLLKGLSFSVGEAPTLLTMKAREILISYNLDKRVLELARRVSTNNRLKMAIDREAVVARGTRYQLLQKIRELQRELKGKPPLGGNK